MSDHKLHQCPYEKACTCAMDEGCDGCETFAATNGIPYLPRENEAKDKRIAELEAIIAALLETMEPDERGNIFPAIGPLAGLRDILKGESNA